MHSIARDVPVMGPYDIAKAAALMTDTTMTSRLLGGAWPRHFSVSATKNVPCGGSSLGFPTDFAVCLFDVGTDAKLLSGISEAIDEPEVFGEVDVLLDLVQRRSLCI